MPWSLAEPCMDCVIDLLFMQVSNHECESLEDEMVRKLLVVKKSNIGLEPSDFKHYKLAVLTIYGFQPGDMFMQYMRRVMEVAVNLEEISLHDHWCEECDFYPLTRYPKTNQDRIDTGRDQQREAVPYEDHPSFIQYYQVEPMIDRIDAPLHDLFQLLKLPFALAFCIFF